MFRKVLTPSQLQVKLLVMIWDWYLGPADIKDLITPVPSSVNSAWLGHVWCQTLQGSSTLERHMGTFTTVPHPHTCRGRCLLLYLADAGLGSCSMENRAIATTSHISLMWCSWPLSPVWPSFMLTHFYIIRVLSSFIPVLISVNMSFLLSPNREWILKQGDHFMEIWVLELEEEQHTIKDWRAAVLILFWIQEWCNWFHRNPRLPGSWGVQKLSRGNKRISSNKLERHIIISLEIGRRAELLDQ